MGAALRKPRYVANDFQRPVALPIPVAHLVPYVRLPPAPPRERVSLTAIFAAILLTGMIFMLGAIAGTVFWFTYDFHIPSDAPAPASAVEMRLRPPSVVPQPMEVLQTPKAPPVDIILPAENQDAGLAPLSAYEALEAAMPGKHDDRGADHHDAKALLDEAHAQFEKGHEDIALTIYERILLVDPQNPDALKGKAEALKKLDPSAGFLKSVVPEIMQDVPVAPVVIEDAAAEAAMAKSLVAGGKIKEAVIHLDRAVHIEPDNFTYRLDLAILYDRAGQGPKALMLYRQALALSDDSDAPMPPAWTNSIRQRADYLESRFARE